MTITAEQIAERRSYIGASDVPKILGLSRYGTAADVWAEKTCQTEPWAGNANTRAGNALEAAILAGVGDYLMLPVVPSVQTWRHGILGAHPDGFVESEREGNPVVECKLYAYGDWGEPGTDAIPDDVRAQVIAQMLCAKSDTGFVGRMDPRDGTGIVSVYCVPMDVEFARLIVETCERFWRENVLGMVKPDSSLSLGVLERMRRIEGSCATVPDDVAAAYLSAKAHESAVTSAAVAATKAARARLLESLGTAERGITSDGTKISYRDSMRTYTDVEAIRIAHPEIASQFTTTRSGGRRLIVTPPKERA